MVSSQYFSIGALYMAKHFIEGRLPFKKGTFAAAMAFYRKKVAAEHFIKSWDASSKPLYRAELLANNFTKSNATPPAPAVPSTGRINGEPMPWKNLKQFLAQCATAYKHENSP